MTDTTVTIPEGAVALSGGGWAVLRDLDDLTGKQVKEIRRGLDKEKDGTGAMVNELFTRALVAAIEAWHIPKLGGDVRTPEIAGAAVLDMLSARDLRTLERAVDPWLKDLTGGEKVDPTTPPASA